MEEVYKRGAFIVIEGLDRSGKSTQVALLHEQLQAAGISTKIQGFPDRTTPIGKMIDSYLRSQSDLDDHAIHLLFSANRWELVTALKETLNAGTTVLCDRYAFSGIAFSASKGLPYDWCRAPDISLPAPDLTLFLDISPEKAKERGRYGEERYENEEMQRSVRDVFRRMGEEMQQPANEQDQGKWITVDAGQDRDLVAKEIWNHVHIAIQNHSRPLGELWMGRLSS